jgi:hypothetical protein
MPVSGCPFSRAGITDPGYSSSVPDFYLDKPARLRGHFSPMKTTSRLLTTLLLFLSVSLAAPNARAVVPPPDGGYAGFNTAEGQNSLFNLTTGSANTAVGWLSLRTLTGGSFNTATGAGSLLFNTADSNTAVGAAALLLNTTGTLNTAVGTDALVYNDSGLRNTAVGAFALFNNTIGGNNTAVGNFALNSNTTGFNNTAVGLNALVNNSSGDANTAVGRSAGLSVTGSGNVCIGDEVQGDAGVDDTTWIRNINTTNFPFIAGTNNYVTVRMSDGALGWTTVVSSRRYKEDIKPMDKASEALLALKPVTFRLKGELDPNHRPQWGLIAEEVEKVNPDLVDRNNKGEVESVRYDAVNAMLLNEFLKEHRKNEEQEATIADLRSTIAQQRSDFEATIGELKKGMETVTVRLNEQAAQIQKVNAQLAAASPSRGGLEASKFATGRIRGGGPAPQVVNNP